MKKRSIIIFADFTNIDLINKIREKYDPLYCCIKPHITLVFPFESDITTEELKDHMVKCVKGIKPFNILLKGFTSTMDNYLFLNIKKGNDEIIEIHDKLYTGILEKYLYRKLTYLPHITVGQLDNQESLDKVLNELINLNDEFKMIVKEISVEMIDEDENSNIEFKIRL